MRSTVDRTLNDFVQPYRPDIDGLRAIAVLVVAGFHAFPARMPGGFTGVDVFFVISGYLIAGDIIRRLDGGSFTLANFYVRRVRRLFPALLAVLVACTLFGAVVLLPDEFKQLLAHVATSAGFLQNLRLFQESGYFDTGSATKPLLHIWSLAIEEQFYLVCPLLLLAVRAPRLRFALVVVLGLASFAANVVIVRGDADAAYYLPYTRFWEILVGVAIALAPTAGVGTRAWRMGAAVAAAPGAKTASSSERPALADAAAMAGLLLLAASMAFIDRDRSFPGWWALLPTGGTALLVAAGPSTALARRVLSRPALRYVGLISYPLYLWHWPVLVFMRIESPNPSTSLKAAGLLASFGLAVATYHWIEQPVRRPRPASRVSPKLVLAMAALCALSWGASLPSVVLPHAPGLTSAEDGRRRDLNFGLHLPTYPGCSEATRVAALSPTYCLQAAAGRPTAALLGDSHAYALFYGVADVDQRRNWLVLANSSCPPLLGVHVRVAGRDCLPRTEATLRAVAADPRLTTVVLAFLGSYVDVGGPAMRDDRGERILTETVELAEDGMPGATNADLVARGLERTVAALAMTGKRVVLYIDVPELPFSPRDCVDRPLARRRLVSCDLQRADVLRQQAVLRAVIARVQANRPVAQTYDPIATICDATLCRIERGDLFVFRDHHHLSVRGSRLVAEPFVAWLDGPPAPR